MTLLFTVPWFLMAACFVCSQVKVWFQNRRMKHKRQTLSKQSDDGEEKEGGKVKGDKSILLDENSKKSCQNCELPPGMLGEHLSRNNNNNNSTFNNNSNASSGASSVSSTTSTFEKLEEDSRSNESRVLTSPGLLPVKRPNEVVVKTETGVNMCSSPGSKKLGKENLSTRLISPDLPIKTNIPSIPPVSTPGVSPGSSELAFRRSSPTAATAVATATASVTAILPNIANQQVKAPVSGSFPSPPLRADYRVQYRQQYPAGREYTQRAYEYRQASPRPNGMHPPRPRNYQQYPQYCQYNGYNQEYYQRNYQYDPEYNNYYHNYQNSEVHPPATEYFENYQNVEYSPGKPPGSYYEMGHQGGEASSVPHYGVSSPDPFPTQNQQPSATVMTPPNSVRTDSSGEYYTPIQQPYNYPDPPPIASHQQSENSNSSSDFNFLTNLANDFAPEYYQLS